MFRTCFSIGYFKCLKPGEIRYLFKVNAGDYGTGWMERFGIINMYKDMGQKPILVFTALPGKAETPLGVPFSMEKPASGIV